MKICIRKHYCFKKGLTLMEVVIFMAIMAIVSTIAVYTFSGLNKDQSLSRDKDSIISLLKEARTLTLAGKDDSNYSVHFESDKAVLFKGEVYDAMDTSNSVENIGPLSSITDISLFGNGTDVTFKKLSGTTDNSGTITIALSDGSISSTISIFESGIIE